MKTSKHLSLIDNELERGIFMAVYNSPAQRCYRWLRTLMLGIKHILRGLLFSWPLYLLAIAACQLPGGIWLMSALLLPAVYISWRILYRGLREDYENLIRGYIVSHQHRSPPHRK